MKLNLDDIRFKIESGQDALVDGGYLEEDMKIMYQYYDDPEIFKPPVIDVYFQSSREFKLIPFSERYLSMLFKCNIKIEETEDGWLRLHSN